MSLCQLYPEHHELIPLYTLLRTPYIGLQQLSHSALVLAPSRPPLLLLSRTPLAHLSS